MDLRQKVHTPTSVEGVHDHVLQEYTVGGPAIEAHLTPQASGLTYFERGGIESIITNLARMGAAGFKPH